MSPEAKNLITRLLDVDEKTRLGSGPSGDDDIKAHAFFRGVDWEKLEQRHVEAPPVGDSLSKITMYFGVFLLMELSLFVVYSCSR